MKQIFALGISAIIAAALLIALEPAAEAQMGPGVVWPKPSRPDAMGATQLGAESAILPLPPSAANRVEMGLIHQCFQAPPTGAYSHSVVAKTNTGWTLHMGVIVRAAD